MSLPDLTPEEKKVSFAQATKAVITSNRPKLIQILCAFLIENAILLKEVQRLRARLDEEPLPEFKVQA